MELENQTSAQGVMGCPRCSYVRKAVEAAPDWQCPQCGVAYAKAKAAGDKLSRHSSGTRSFTSRSHGTTKIVQQLLSLLFLVSLMLWVVALMNKGNFPDSADILPDLFKEPVQSTVNSSPFVFNYRGAGYEVVPKAGYELWGMVVTHNDIDGFLDRTHTEDSVDIKDICVVWGTNLKSSDFKKIDYSSGDFICYVKYGPGVFFDKDRLSNSHLLSDNMSVREKIRNSRVGDQIHLKGQLVNYRPVDHSMNWRNSSLRRTDTGNGACEVVFVEEFEILKAGTPGLYKLYVWMAILMPVVLILKFSLFVRETLQGR